MAKRRPAWYAENQIKSLPTLSHEESAGMKRLRRFWHGASLFISAGTVWLSLYGPALAQVVMKKEESKSSTTGTGSYVLAYGLVILAIALGLLVVCRSSGRRDRARPEQYAEGKLAGVKAEEQEPAAKKSGK
jgi:hypothetical protein